MTLRKLFNMGLINANTCICIFAPDLDGAIYGKPLKAEILDYEDVNLERFTQYHDNMLIIDLCQSCLALRNAAIGGHKPA